MKNESLSKNNSSLFEYIRCELKRGYHLQNDEQRYRERREKFYIFLKIPYKLETFLFYGFFQCVDAFLSILTFLPIRLLLSLITYLYQVINLFIKFLLTFEKKYLKTIISNVNTAEKCDILKGLILIISYKFIDNIEISIFYHQIKSQSIIKLYIFFNMLEVADKLLSSFGQDILDTLYWTATESTSTIGKKRHYIFIIFHLLLAIFYVSIHTILVLLQATTLNVAINSKNKALITIMMSNNFVELKSMVFKKFEKNNLFHMSCSDVRERLHYIVLLIIVIIQTMNEYNWSDEQLLILLSDCFMVLSVEIFVDWFKHAFVTRFNEISYDVYEDYSLSLAYDLIGSKLKSAFSDHSDIVSRRMGFIPLPLSVLLMKILFTSFQFNQNLYSYLCILVFYLNLIIIKLIINIILLAQSCKWVQLHQKTLNDKINKVLGGHSTSLPTSRHNSVSDLTTNNLSQLDFDDNLLIQEKNSIDQQQQQQQQLSPIKTQSQPHSPINGSPKNNSLEDITKQVEIVQKSLEETICLSDSTVSLISMNDGQNINVRLLPLKQSSSVINKCPEEEIIDDNDQCDIFNNDENVFTSSKILKHPPMTATAAAAAKTNIIRRVSLQELPTNSFTSPSPASLNSTMDKTNLSKPKTS